MRDLRPEEGKNLLELVQELDPDPILALGLFNLSGPCLPGASRLMGRQIWMFLPWPAEVSLSGWVIIGRAHVDTPQGQAVCTPRHGDK